MSPHRQIPHPCGDLGDGTGAVTRPPELGIILRPIGSPLTVGMAGLGIASLVQSGLDLRWVAVAQSHQVGLILLSVPFLLQMLACVLSYLARDGAMGAAVGVLSVSWLAQGLIHVTAPAGTRSGALGLMLLAAGGMIALSAVAIGLAKPLPAGVLGLAAARFALAGIYELGGSSACRTAAGIVGLVVLAAAAYCTLAFELEGLQHRTVLPTFRRGRGKLALSGQPAERINGVTGEPGVRQTT